MIDKQLISRRLFFKSIKFLRMNPQIEIEILKLEKTIAELDADWYKRQGRFKILGRGKYYNPIIEEVSNVLFALLILVSICVALAFYQVLPKSKMYIIFDLLIIAVFTFGFYQNRQKAKHYEAENAKYEKQKENLLLEIQKLKTGV